MSQRLVDAEWCVKQSALQTAPPLLQHHRSYAVHRHTTLVRRVNTLDQQATTITTHPALTTRTPTAAVAESREELPTPIIAELESIARHTHTHKVCGGVPQGQRRDAYKNTEQP
eukprot:Blabericola_migrator_1__114@NODE_1029_length_5656_cov_134_262122_g709_i0_p2_GENE_NODE_1029_length_5656_cov_134_262122_g709_i0NODE_1029_length_5656_cov_134_262122_g709_i0_p2_ORF_typecomplete_len114_score21_29_NODE_1029_length_5656_cov_134_262122_g709_i052485589